MCNVGVCMMNSLVGIRFYSKILISREAYFTIFECYTFRLWNSKHIMIDQQEFTVGFTGGASGKESICQCRTHLPMQDTSANMWVPSLSQEDPQQKEMATPSSILAWEMPWTEEPGGLQSMRSQSHTTDWLSTAQNGLSTIKNGIKEVRHALNIRAPYQQFGSQNTQK